MNQKNFGVINIMLNKFRSNIFSTIEEAEGFIQSYKNCYGDVRNDTNKVLDWIRSRIRDEGIYYFCFYNYHNPTELHAFGCTTKERMWILHSNYEDRPVLDFGDIKNCWED